MNSNSSDTTVSAARFAPDQWTSAVGGEWVGGRRPDAELAVYTDSRESGVGRLFLALRGEKFDANTFLDAAVAGGAAALIADRSAAGRLPAGVPALLVDDTLEAYRALARFHRRRFPGLKLAAVTGSVGKTSVKEMLRAIFIAAAGDENAVLHTLGNTNNQVGVPRNLLRLTAAHRYAVLEAGTNHPGEIEPLSRCMEPQAAVINSIAPCHLEALGNLAGVAAEKARIFTGLAADGAAVIPQEAPALETLEAAARPFRLFRFGVWPDADVRAEYRSGSLEGSDFTLTFRSGEHFDLHWSLSGAHQALNAAAAAAAALALGVAPDVIAAGLAATVLPGMRMARTVIDRVTWLNDAYNANPDSMSAALRTLAAAGHPGPILLLLGDMLELGGFEPEGHTNVLKLALHLFPEAQIVTVGPRFARAASKLDGAAGVVVCGSAESAGVQLRKLAAPDSLVFLKGSRGMALEKAIPASR